MQCVRACVQGNKWTSRDYGDRYGQKDNSYDYENKFVQDGQLVVNRCAPIHSIVHPLSSFASKPPSFFLSDIGILEERLVWIGICSK